MYRDALNQVMATRKKHYREGLIEAVARKYDRTPSDVLRDLEILEKEHREEAWNNWVYRNPNRKVVMEHLRSVEF